MNRTSNNLSVGDYDCHPVLRYGKCRMLTLLCQGAHIKPGGFVYEPGYVTYRKRSRTPEIG